MAAHRKCGASMAATWQDWQSQHLVGVQGSKQALLGKVQVGGSLLNHMLREAWLWGPGPLSPEQHCFLLRARGRQCQCCPPSPGGGHFRKCWVPPVQLTRLHSSLSTEEV